MALLRGLLLMLCSSSLGFAPQRRHASPALAPRFAVDYEAELYESRPLGRTDSELVEWCEEWVQRAVLGRGGSAATVKLTTPVDVSRGADFVKLAFKPRNTGYGDKDKDKDDWDESKSTPSPPPTKGEGGVMLVVGSGAIRAKRCGYDGGIIKQMSEDKIINQFKKDVQAGFK